MQQPDNKEEMNDFICSLVKKQKKVGKLAANATAKSDSKNFIMNFKMTPSEVMQRLGNKVINQEEAVRILTTKICSHYHAIRSRIEKGDQPENDVDRIKPNILLIGPTGVGKTYLIKLIAQIIGAPFVNVDATKYSETGYVGGDVEDMLRDLGEKVRDIDGNIDMELFQYGIIFIDEIDKIASVEHNTTGPDVSRLGVQRALLTLVEGADVRLEEEYVVDEERKPEDKEWIEPIINTKNILFIFAGSFPGLDEIIKKRVGNTAVGFNTGKKNITPGESLKVLETKDLVTYGFESEFIGRIPIRVSLNHLNENDLFAILNRDGSPIIANFKEAMGGYGIKVGFDEDALRYIAQQAAHQNTGARGLLSAFSKAIGPYESFLPDTGIAELQFALPMVNGKYDALEFIRKFKEEMEKTGKI